MEPQLSLIEQLQLITLTLLVLLGLSAKSSAELYDVTTIYRLQEGPRNEDYYTALNRSKIAETKDLKDRSWYWYLIVHKYCQGGAIEIHARTNALGLPFSVADSENNTISGPTVGIEFPECYPHTKSGCENWLKIKWENTQLAISKIPPLERSYSRSTVTTAGSDLSTLRNFNKNGIKIVFQPKVIGGRVKIFLLDKQGNFKTSDMYYIQIPTKDYITPEASLLKCTSTNLLGKDWYILGDDLSRNCVTEKTSKNDFQNLDGREKYTVHISIVKNTINVSIENYDCHSDSCISRKDLFTWKDSDPIDVKYIAVTTRDMLQGKFMLQLQNENNILSLNDKEGSLISPKFTPSSNKICISVVYYLSPNYENDLKLAVRLEDGNEFTLENMEKSEEWQIKRYIKEIPNNASLENIKLVVHGRKSMNSHVLIQRLASCNAESEEDILVLPDDYPLEFRKAGYDVAGHRIKSCDPVSWKKNCAHGKFDEDTGKCVCPVGFTGETCEKGCGPNSYGADCGGRCSWSKRGCREMILCRPELGCSCAPGFTGYLCNVPCINYTYGPDCAYECGRCKNKKCNPYTGTCLQGCIPGFRPPICKETYKYVKTPPRVLSGYNWLVVKTELSEDNLYGTGRPLFYQFQYKEDQSESWIGKEPQLIQTSVLSKHDDAYQVSLNVTELDAGRKYQLRFILIDEDGNSFQDSQIPCSTEETLCDEPDAVPTELQAVNITATGFTIFWKFKSKSDKWCSMIKFEVQVKEGWQWLSYSNGTDSFAVITELLPGMTYKVRVRGLNSKGLTKFSETLSITTGDGAPSEVVDLKVISTKSNGLHLSWKKPYLTAGNIKHYIITYECIRLLGCHNVSCDQSSKHMKVSDTSVTLNNLKSNAIYKIVVAGVSGTNGSSVEILAVTNQTLPSVSPGMSSIAMNNITNSSFTVQWKPPIKCTYYNGYALGYYYVLMEQNKSSDSGNTIRTQITFSGLHANTQYLVKVYLLTTKGWNEEYPLILSVKTLSEDNSVTS